MGTLSADELKSRAEYAAQVSWMKSPDGVARTANARAAYIERFEMEADPDGLLPLEERQRIAARLRKAALALARFEAAKARRLAEEAQSDDTSAA